MSKNNSFIFTVCARSVPRFLQVGHHQFTFKLAWLHSQALFQAYFDNFQWFLWTLAYAIFVPTLVYPNCSVLTIWLTHVSGTTPAIYLRLVVSFQNHSNLRALTSRLTVCYHFLPPSLPPSFPPISLSSPFTPYLHRISCAERINLRLCWSIS